VIAATACVIVVARNEAARIGRCLASVRAQSHTPEKVILVDDGSTDDTVALALAACPELVVLHCHTRSLARNRNSGWRAADTDYVAFLDADCEAPAHWLANLLGEAERSGADAVGGGNRPPGGEGAHFAALGIMLDSFVGSRGSIQGTLPRERHEIDHLPTLNVLYRRDSLERAGGFDPGFQQVGEDEDLSRRMRAAGATFVAIADATVVHRQRSDIVSWARNMFKYGKGRTWLLRRHPGIWSPLFLAPPLMWLILPLYLPAIASVALWCCIARGRPQLWGHVFALFVATHLPYGAGQIAGYFTHNGVSRRRRVALLALKNAGNKGDEAIVRTVAMRALQHSAATDFYLAAFGPSGFDVRLLPSNPEALDAAILQMLSPTGDARTIRPSVFVLDAIRCLLTFMRFDNVVISGGQWLHDLSLARHTAICLLFAAGRCARTKVGVFCVGVGPLQRQISRRLVRLAFGRHAMMITRDEGSTALLERCGLRRVGTATDPVIQMPSEPVSRDPSRVLISPCAWTSFANLYDQDAATIADTRAQLDLLVQGLLERRRLVAFLPTMNPEDQAIARSVARPGVEVIETDAQPPQQVQQAIAGAGLLLSMRLHPVIFATNVGTPTIALNYATKVESFCKQAGIARWLVDLSAADWAKRVLAEVDAMDADAFRKQLECNRPAMLGALDGAYETLFSWFPKYERQAGATRRQTERTVDAHRLC